MKSTSNQVITIQRLLSFLDCLEEILGTRKDDFYPVHLQTIKREATPTGNTQQVTVDLSTLSHWRNDFSRLFPDDNQNRTGPGGMMQPTNRSH